MSRAKFGDDQLTTIYLDYTVIILKFKLNVNSNILVKQTHWTMQWIIKYVLTRCSWYSLGKFEMSKHMSVQIVLVLRVIMVYVILEPLLLTWIDFNPSMDKQSNTQLSVG